MAAASRQSPIKWSCFEIQTQPLQRLLNPCRLKTRPCYAPFTWWDRARQQWVPVGMGIPVGSDPSRMTWSRQGAEMQWPIPGGSSAGWELGWALGRALGDFQWCCLQDRFSTNLPFLLAVIPIRLHPFPALAVVLHSSVRSNEGCFQPALGPLRAPKMLLWALLASPPLVSQGFIWCGASVASDNF